MGYVRTAMLDKLIEQYEQKTGEVARTKTRYCYYREDGEPDEAIRNTWTDHFVEWLANRPTCGVEQRKFLDEVETKGEMAEHGSHLTLDGKNTRYYELLQIDFVSDLSKVIKGE